MKACRVLLSYERIWREGGGGDSEGFKLKWLNDNYFFGHEEKKGSFNELQNFFKSTYQLHNFPQDTQCISMCHLQFWKLIERTRNLQAVIIFPLPAKFPFVLKGLPEPSQSLKVKGGVHPGHFIASPHKEKQPLTLTPKGPCVESPVNLWSVFLDCRRKPEYPEETHACMWRTCKHHKEGS